MPRAVSKLMFSICLLIATSFSGIVRGADVDNWCYCSGDAYLHWESPQYGPWIYLDEAPFGIDEQLSNPGDDGAGLCALECYGVGTYQVGFLCGTYSDTEYPNQHWRFAFQYYFDDPENKYGGSDGGEYDTGLWVILYCE